MEFFPITYEGIISIILEGLKSWIFQSWIFSAFFKVLGSGIFSIIFYRPEFCLFLLYFLKDQNHGWLLIFKGPDSFVVIQNVNPSMGEVPEGVAKYLLSLNRILFGLKY